MEKLKEKYGTERVAKEEKAREKLRNGELDDKEIEVEMQASGGGMPTFEIKVPVGANQIWMKGQIRSAIAEATKRGKLARR